jgi:hypothetical protein
MIRRRARRLAQLGVLSSAVLGARAVAASPPETTEISALSAELERGVEGLRLPDSPEPYAAHLRVLRGELLTLAASYGSVVIDVRQQLGQGRVTVHVGDREHDESGFFGGEGSPEFGLPLRPSPEASRYLLWRAMDQAYRGSVAQFTAKSVIIEQLADPPTIPDHAPPPPGATRLDWSDGQEDGSSPPLLSLDAPSSSSAPALDRERLRKLVASLSARFADHPDVDDGQVIFEFARTDATRFDHEPVSEEGAGAGALGIRGERRDRGFLAVVADARAEDGMQVDHGAVIHLTGAELPQDLEARAQAMVDRVLVELEAMQKAPMMEEDYDGPILFGDEAAAQVLASLVAVHGSGEPAPLSEWGRVIELEPHWAERLGKSVLPDHFGLVDDPTTSGFGHYEHDAEGVPGQRVEMVRGGVLRELLMTRRPNEHIDHSNGHARESIGVSRGPSISNLSLTTTRRGSSRAALEKDLLRRAREDGYEYAYVIETLRDGNVLGPVPRDTAQLFGAGRKVTLSIPARVFRVDTKGRTLVRGALIAPVSMRALRRIRAHGRSTETHPMRIAPGITGGFGADLGTEGLLSQTVDVEIRTPALLIDGFELVVERGEHERPPTLVHPLRVVDQGEDETGLENEERAEESPRPAP